MAADRGWAATVLLLGAPRIAERSYRHVDLAARRVHWAGLLGDAASWAEPHRLLVLAAYDLSGAAEDLRGTPVSGPPVAVLSLHELATADESTVHRVGARSNSPAAGPATPLAWRRLADQVDHPRSPGRQVLYRRSPDLPHHHNAPAPGSCCIVDRGGTLGAS